MNHLAAAIVTVLGAVLDRGWGSDLKITLWGKEHGSHVITSALCVPLAIAAFFILGAPAAALLVAWAIYRCLDFTPGSLAPTSGAEDLNAIVRHFWAVPLSVAALAITHAPLGRWFIFPVYVVFAFGLALLNGLPPKGSRNAYVEPARGACYFAAAAYALGLL